MADIQRKTLVVDEGGTGDYRTLTDAVAACADTPNEPVRFYIKHGIYEERPFIELADYSQPLWAAVTPGRARVRPEPSAVKRCFWAAAGPLCAT